MKKNQLISLFFIFSFVVLTCSAGFGSALKNQDLQIGIYVYTWYDPTYAVNWEYPKIVDRPVLGLYNSCDPSVIVTQLQQIEDLGVDYVMLNWMGLGTFSDVVCGEWFRIAYENMSKVKLALMIEPFNEVGGYDYGAIYDRAYELYDSYEAQCLLAPDPVNNLVPVLFWYNGGVLTGEDSFTLPLDNRFVSWTIGHRNYVDFWYDDVHQNYVPPATPYNRQISVVPRFDDFWQYKMGLRDHTDTIDRELNEGFYEEQWNRAARFVSQGKLDFVNIVTWNEYPERTAVEPHYDNTAWTDDPNYLYDLTKEKISALKGLPSTSGEQSGYWYQDLSLVLIMLVISAVAVVWVVRR